MTLQYTIGDATAPVGSGKKIVTHVCNNRSGWGKGFVVAVSARWPLPESEYRAWSRTTGFRLGAVQFVHVEQNIWVANMVAQNGYGTTSGPTPLDYDALKECLTKVGEHAVRVAASVHMPRIGTGLGGGRWEDIVLVLDQTLIARGITTTVYDLTSR